MVEGNFTTLLFVLLFAGVLFYRFSFFHKTWIGYFSLLQIIYLVVIPGFLIPLSYAYIRSIMERPFSESVFLPDTFLINALLISFFITNTGIAIHSIGKMLWHAGLHKESSDAAHMLRFFHLSFSHNLVFGGGLVCLAGLVLLEMNHMPAGEPNAWMSVLKGVSIGLLFILTMMIYARSNDETYSGRWGDLKFFFLILWLVFITLLYGIKRVDPRIGDYELLLPALLSFSLMAFLNIVLVIRRLKRGGFRVTFSRKRFERLLEPET